MNLLTRPIVAVVCPLFVLLAAGPAMGQRFVPQEIVQADPITPEMVDQILMVVDPLMFDLIQNGAEVDAEEVAEARDGLLDQFRRQQATDAYLVALSKAITDSRMADAVAHKSHIVRYNAMLVLAEMVDAGSEPLVNAGLKDKNDAVKRGAVVALGNRMIWWKDNGQNAKITAGINQIVTLVDQNPPPHPVVVGAALEALLKVNTPASREALIELLNKRVALHAADPDLTYSAEMPVIEQMSATLRLQKDAASSKGLGRAMFRYASLITGQLQANRIAEESQGGVDAMLFVCLRGIQAVSLGLGLQAQDIPAAQVQAEGWIKNGRWEELSKLVNEDWHKVLTVEPFGLKADGLKVEQDD